MINDTSASEQTGITLFMCTVGFQVQQLHIEGQDDKLAMCAETVQHWLDRRELIEAQLDVHGLKDIAMTNSRPVASYVAQLAAFGTLVAAIGDVHRRDTLLSRSFSSLLLATNVQNIVVSTAADLAMAHIAEKIPPPYHVKLTEEILQRTATLLSSDHFHVRVSWAEKQLGRSQYTQSETYRLLYVILDSSYPIWRAIGYRAEPDAPAVLPFLRKVAACSQIRTATEKGGNSKEEDEAAGLEEKEGPGTLGLRIECRVGIGGYAGLRADSSHLMRLLQKCRQTVDGPDDCLVLHASDHSPRKRYVCTKCGTQASRLIDLEPHHRRCPFRGGGAGRVLDRADHSLVNTWYREFTQCFAEPDHECFINGLMIMKEDEMARAKSTPVPST
ncbi:unnamed protein product, partial [Mesorhabditis spiculigera]